MSPVLVILVSVVAGACAGLLAAWWYVEGLEGRVAWLERHDKARAPEPSQDVEGEDDWDWPRRGF